MHKDYENLLESNILKKLYDFTNQMMTVKMNYADREWVFEDFCKKPTPESVSFKFILIKDLIAF